MIGFVGPSAAIGAIFISVVVSAAVTEPVPLPDWAIGPFTRPASGNPVIRPRPESRFACPMRQAPVAWEALHYFNPGSTIFNDTVAILYRAEDDSGTNVIGMHTSRLGLATSSDGIFFTRRTEPVLYPDIDAQKEYEWIGGCEDPRLIAVGDGTWLLTYTQWNRTTPRLAIATSSDLVHWEKHGPAFAHAPRKRYMNMASKSGAIVGQLQRGQVTAVKINGLYWMYWGAGTVHLATSPDLINWTPVESPDGTLQQILSPRAGKFDSALCEPGPAALRTEHGILLIYNGENAEINMDPSIPAHQYSVGQVLFDPEDPTRVVARLDVPCFQPRMPYEMTGQYKSGTTFCEGLVRFHGKWLLYYGCADSFVGVATAP
jgi:beta-1,2-mannosidase